MPGCWPHAFCKSQQAPVQHLEYTVKALPPSASAFAEIPFPRDHAEVAAARAQVLHPYSQDGVRI
eukprot:8851890-Alexandrium_andersonii.AAC.1